MTVPDDNFLLGALSESENNTIAAGLNDVIMDHLVDVVDSNGATDLLFRSGPTKAIQPSSWIVNCTGYLKPNDRPYEPARGVRAGLKRRRQLQINRYPRHQPTSPPITVGNSRNHPETAYR
jgi:hypothetical protein